MLAVLSALGTIAVVVAAGWFAGRTGVLGDNAQRVLAATAFTVATPALLIETIGRADLGLLLSRSALVTFATTTVVALVAAAVLGLIRRRSAGDVVVGVLASSYVNAGNIGIPLTAYLLSSVVSVVPPTLYQQLVLGPIAMVVLDARRRASDGVVAGTAPAGALGTLRSVLRRTLRNPVIIGTLTGIALAALPFSLPAVVLQPLELLGAAAPPLALLTFGMSLAAPGSAASRPRAGTSRWSPSSERSCTPRWPSGWGRCSACGATRCSPSRSCPRCRPRRTCSCTRSSTGRAPRSPGTRGW